MAGLRFGKVFLIGHVFRWPLKKPSKSAAVDLKPNQLKTSSDFTIHGRLASMSLERKHPIYTAGRPGGNVMLQRFCWAGKTQFNYQFTLRLVRNTKIAECEENEILNGTKKATSLRNARKLFDKVMHQLGHDLDTFTGWRTSAITRFTLCTIDDSRPTLIIDDDPSTIQYHSFANFRDQFKITCI